LRFFCFQDRDGGVLVLSAKSFCKNGYMLSESPLRLPLGKDALNRIPEKNAFVDEEIAKWCTLAESTEFSKTLSVSKRAMPLNEQSTPR
jgi:hypothetical protein